MSRYPESSKELFPDQGSSRRARLGKILPGGFRNFNLATYHFTHKARMKNH